MLFIRSIVLRFRRQRRRAFASFRTAVMLPLAYMFALLVVSMTSHQRSLSPGVSKCFGDWCAVVTQALTDGPRGVVDLSLRNQGTRAEIRPEQPIVCLVDPKGRRIAPVDENGPPLTGPLLPGQTVIKEYRFNIPKDMQFPMVWIAEGGWLTRFLIGGENSFLHPREVTPLR